ncbi:MAG: Na+/H+ antiporter subunit E [Candidatus Accumulibacter sp.]|jgi:multicomponent K+:H+ antiporter subunit E|nr:Na+/H+ antiporter subunit E [Accumulibacter sp.]
MKLRPSALLLPLFLLLAWLLLTGSASGGNVLLGLACAVSITAAVAALRPLRARPRRLQAAIGRCWHVAVDIVRSNLAVAGIILGAARRPPRVGFVSIPLDLGDAHGLALLAVILTATPGSVWAKHDAKSKELTLHVLDLQDEAAWVRTVKQRYERPLMEIFE